MIAYKIRQYPEKCRRGELFTRIKR